MPAKLRLNLHALHIELEADDAEQCMKLLGQVSSFLAENETPFITSEDAARADEPGVAEGESESDSISQGTNGDGAKQNGKKPRAKKQSSPLTIPPLPVDLTGGESGLSLAKFVEGKNPQRSNAQELVPVLAFWLREHAGVTAFKPGHIVTCYDELEIPKLGNLPMVLYNIQRRKGWVQLASKEEGTWGLSVTGENLVKYKLPRKKEVS